MCSVHEDNPIEREIPPLCQAVNEGNLQQVKQLIEKGVDLQQRERGLFTPLQCAVGLGHLEIVRILLQAGALVSNQTKWLLERAKSEDKTEILLELIKAGIDINQRILDDDGQTVLMDAAGRGCLRVVKALVEAGADVNIRCNHGTFALIKAAEQGHQEVFDYLAPLNSPDLRQEAENALPRGLILRQRLNNQFTESFIEAAAMGDANAVINAIKNRVNINAFGADGNTALYIAANWGHRSIVSILVEAGAALEIGRESDSETPLIASIGNLSLAKSNFGSSVIEKNLLEIIALLLKAGANINATTTEGWTALMAAANAGSVQAVMLLLQAGANVNVKNIRGDNALSLAKKAKHQEIVQLLQEAGASES